MSFYLANMNSISTTSDKSKQQGLLFKIFNSMTQKREIIVIQISESNYAAIDLPGAPLSLNVDNYQALNLPASSPNTGDYQALNLPADNQQHESNYGPLPESSNAKVVLNNLKCIYMYFVLFLIQYTNKTCSQRRITISCRQANSLITRTSTPISS